MVPVAEIARNIEAIINSIVTFLLNSFNIYLKIVDTRALNNRERTMAVFTHRKADRLIWQPRLHHWHEVNKARGFLPKKYKDWDILQIYDDLGASPRSYHYFSNVIRTVEGDGVRIELKEDVDYVYTKYMTVEKIFYRK